MQFKVCKYGYFCYKGAFILKTVNYISYLVFIYIEFFWFSHEFVVYVPFPRFIFFFFVCKKLGIRHLWFGICWLESWFYKLMHVLYRNFSVSLIFFSLKRAIFYFKKIKFFFYYFYYLRQVIYILYFLLIILLRLFPFSI